jgi:hypothetical protein
MEEARQAIDATEGQRFILDRVTPSPPYGNLLAARRAVERTVDKRMRAAGSAA